MAAEVTQPFLITPRWVYRLVLDGELTGMELVVLNWLSSLANPRTGTCYTNAPRVASDLTSWATRTIQEVFQSLRRKLRIWYPGETTGQKKYLVMVDGYVRSDKTILHIFHEDGSLTKHARELAKKLARLDEGFFTSPKVTVIRSPASEAPHRRGVPRTVAVENPAESGPCPDAEPYGPAHGKGGSAPGFSAPDAAQVRTVDVGDHVGHAAPPPNEREVRLVSNTPVVPAGDDTHTGPSGESVQEAKAIRKVRVRSLCAHFSLALEHAIPGYRTKAFGVAEMFIAEELFDKYGYEAVAGAITAGLEDDYWRRGLHTFRSLKKNWGYIQALKGGNGNGHSRPAGGSHRKAPVALPGADAFTRRRPPGKREGKPAGDA